MANKTITDLPSATTVGQTDEIEIAQSGVSKRATINKLTSLVTGPTGPAGPAGPTGPAATPGGAQFATQYNGGSALAGGSLGTALQVWTSNGVGVAPSMQTIPNFSSGAAGHAPASGGGTSNFLRADGSWAAPPATVLSANPSASIGLTQVNGVATTFMRSDAAPALDVSVSPTWSGTHTFAVTPVVPDDSWTYAKIQDISATSRLLGRVTAGAGSIEELTGTQATTILDAFTSTLKGLAPASGGGTTNFLRADGTWAAPTNAVPGGSDTYVQYNDSSAFGGDANFTWNKTTRVLGLGNGGGMAATIRPPAGSGASLTINSGSGAATSTGGILVVQAGSGGATSGTGGQVRVIGGAGVDGNGGSSSLIGGTAVGTNRTGGAASAIGGPGVGSGAGGNVNITAGAGGATGAGGALVWRSGTGGATSGNSGVLDLATGTCVVGNSGSVTIASGAGGTTSGNSGDISLFTGAVTSGTKGVLKLGAGAATHVQIDGTTVEILNAPIKLPSTAVASLIPAATAGAGARQFVTDALAPAFGDVVAGSGAVFVPVYSDGTDWRVG